MVDDQALNLLAAGNVTIERHRADTEVAGDCPHGQGVETLAIDNPQSCFSDGCVIE